MIDKKPANPFKTAPSGGAPSTVFQSARDFGPSSPLPVSAADKTLLQLRNCHRASHWQATNVADFGNDKPAKCIHKITGQSLVYLFAYQSTSMLIHCTIQLLPSPKRQSLRIPFSLASNYPRSHPAGLESFPLLSPLLDMLVAAAEKSVMLISRITLLASLQCFQQKVYAV